MAFLYVDREIGARLEGRTHGRLSAVYSDAVQVSERSLTDRTRLIGQLVARRYREVAHEPVTAGEYTVDPNSLTVRTRPFVGSDGATRPSLLAKVNFSTGEISSDGRDGAARFLLEPQIVSPLGNGELRANKFTPLADIPPLLRSAVLAIEDQRFYQHFGVDLIGIGRAVWMNVKALRIVQGGSTLTQQLAKNLFFSSERSFGRKFKELFAALSLEHRLSKDQILEMYLNEVYLGQEGAVAIHGVAEAAEVFFGKGVKDLSLAESALLAGIIQAPSAYSPRLHPERALRRRGLVLSAMVETSAISAHDAEIAARSRIKLVRGNLHRRAAPYFLAALQQELQHDFNLEAATLAGLHVHTGLNLEMQRCAEESLTKGIASIEHEHPHLRRRVGPLQGALVSLEPYSGRVRAWVGGRDFQRNQFDRVHQARRQIGSTIKPFLYVTALDRTLNTYKVATPITLLPDSPLEIELPGKDSWVPENYDRSFHGEVTVRQALEQSLNLPAAYVGQRVGISTFAAVLKKFRLSDAPLAVPALALGALDTTLLQLTAGFAALANGGSYIAPRLFLSALDDDAHPLATSPIAEERVTDEGAAFVLTYMLEGVLERGTGKKVRALGYTRPAAGKTGTSSDARDAWFVGYTPTLTTGVWIGFDDNTPIGLTGGAIATPIWTSFMQCVDPYIENLPFVQPSSALLVDIDTESRMRAGPECPSSQVAKEAFVVGTEPRALCSLHNHGIEEEVPDFHSLPSHPEPRRERSFWQRVFG